MSATWVSLDYIAPTKKTNTEQIEFCNACKTSFDSWRAARLEVVSNNNG